LFLFFQKKLQSCNLIYIIKGLMVNKASLKDARDIHLLITKFAAEKWMLPRSLNYIYEHLRDFWVDRQESGLRGCCSLNIIGWQGLGEIKSLAVDTLHQNKGIGKSLVQACLDESKRLELKKVFALTYQPDFFKKCGFIEIDKQELPHKIWADCLNCPEFPNCKEIALIKEI
jgi:amino-acid N-acetyltransferase